MTKNEPTIITYVIGHKNPDTDSICSAVAYTQLAILRGERGVVAAAQGEMRPETRYILERWGIRPPQIVRDVRPRVRDLMTTDPISAYTHTNLLEVTSLLQGHNIRAVPIVDEANHLVGLFSVEDFASFFMTGLAPEFIETVRLNAHTMAAVLGGTILVEAEERELSNKVMVGAMSTQSMLKRLIDEDHEGYVMVMGDREEAQCAAIEHGIGALVVTGDLPVSDMVMELAHKKRVWIISSPHHTFTTVRLLIMSVPVSVGMQREVLTVDPTDLAEDALQKLARDRTLPVVNDDGKLVGIVSRSDLLKQVNRRVILVDHNERGQSVEGLEKVELVGIIDHHRIADVQTATPIFIRMEPVGATCTIIAGLYEEADIPISQAMAGIMLGAILVDTVILRSPTCTARDRRIAAQLAEIAGVNQQEYGMQIFEHAGDVEGKSARQIIINDFKEFDFGDDRYGVGVIETMHTRVVDPLKPDLLEELHRMRKEEGYRAVLLAIVDIIHEKSEILVSGDEHALAEAFGHPIENHTISISSLVVRKRDIVPALARAVEMQTNVG